jgi:hypothetical protein
MDIGIVLKEMDLYLGHRGFEAGGAPLVLLIKVSTDSQSIFVWQPP